MERCKGLNTGDLHNLLDFGFGRERFAEDNVFPERAAQKLGVLPEITDALSQDCGTVTANFRSIDKNRPFVRRVESAQQFAEGRFSRTYPADNADPLSRRD